MSQPSDDRVPSADAASSPREDALSAELKRKHDRIPPALKIEMQRAIALIRREYGSKHYDLVRERPEFAPWIGKATSVFALTSRRNDGSGNNATPAPTDTACLMFSMLSNS